MGARIIIELTDLGYVERCEAVISSGSRFEVAHGKTIAGAVNGALRKVEGTDCRQ